MSACTTRNSGYSSLTDKAQPTVASLITNFSGETRISDFSIRTQPKALVEIPNNASGITWHPYLKQYFIIRNNAAVIYRYDQNFKYLGQLKKTGKINNDTEGLTYSDSNHVLIVTEANTAHRVELNQQIFNGLYFWSNSDYRLDSYPKQKNKGFEAIAFRPPSASRTARIYAGQEGSRRYPNAKMRVVYFDASARPSFMSRLLTEEDEHFKVVEPFNAEEKFAGVITDISGMTFDPVGKTLIIVSQESHKAIQVDPATGELLSQLPLTGAPSYEGVTIGPNGQLVFVSEKNWVQIYTKNNNDKVSMQ